MRLAISSAMCAIAFGAAFNVGAAEAADPPKAADSSETSAFDSPGTVGELTLGRHRFQLPALQTSAFMTTHFGLRQTVHVIHVPDAPLIAGATTRVDALGVGENLEFGVQVLKRFEGNLSLGADAYTGTGVRSILVGGAGYSYRGSLGAGFNLFRGETTEFSVRLHGDLGSARKTLFLNLLNDLSLQAQVQTVLQIVNGNIGRLIVSTAHRGAGTLSLNLAQSLGPAFGVQFFAGISYADIDIGYVDSATGRPTDADLAVWTPQLAAEAEVDLRRLMPAVPVAVDVEYAFNSPHVKNRSSDSSDWFHTSNTIALGVYYSGRRELSLGGNVIHVINLETDSGIDAQGRTFPVGRPHFDVFQLTLRYTW